MIVIDLDDIKAMELPVAPKAELSISFSEKNHVFANSAKPWAKQLEKPLNALINELMKDELTPPRSEAKKFLSEQCWEEYNTVRIEQAQMSNRIALMVANGASKQELADLHAEIESYRPELQRLFHVARHVDQYGVLPELKVEKQMPSDIFSLKDQKRKLVDVRCKLAKKIKQGSLKEHKVIEWQLELEKANAEYNQVDEQLKKLEGK